MTAAILVTYPAAPGARFDRDYYAATHIPLIAEVFGPHGYTGATILVPDEPEPALVAAVILHFRDAAARTAALAAPGAARVPADVANFTDIAPVIQPFTIPD